MKNFTTFFLFFFIFSLNIFLKNKLSAQTVSTTIVYTGFQGCGGCTVCGADYYCFNTLNSYCGNTPPCGTKTFIDPIPPGNIVTSVLVNYFSAQCTGGSLTATLDGNIIPAVNETNTGCPCSINPCGISASSSSSFPCGLPGYVYGGVNTLQLCTGANVCINQLNLVFTYAPANQSTPATQPGSISGSSTFCTGVPQTFSIPAVANASSYTWSVPAGWIINSGQGTTSINATPGTAGNICVIANNTCGSSAQTCFGVILNTPSSAPTSASATPPSICGSGSSNLTVGGGSLGTGATWEWYSGSCGGTLVGTGSSITVSASSTTTYYIRAVGSCNTTACASVVLTVNPIPTANAGPTTVLTCNVPSVVLGGSGGGNYIWSGPGIVSGGNSATPTVNQPGTYSLIVTSLGCNSSVSTVNITQNITAPTGVAASAVGTSTLNCSITTINLSGSPSTGVTYSWSGPGIVSGGNTANPVVNQPGAYSLVVTNTSNGCSNASAPAVVSISQASVNIAGSATTNSIITCVSTSANLNANPAGYTYTWTAPGGSSVTSGVNSQNAMGSGPGTYSVIIKDVSTGCFILSTITIPQNITTPTGVSAASGDTIFCNTPTVTLSSTPGTGVTYSWSGPGIVSGGNTANPTVNAAGSYSLVVTNTSNGCSNTASPAVVNVIANVTLPTGVNAGPNAVLPCNPGTISLSGVSTSTNITYSWGGPNNYSFSGQNPNNINSPGQYTLTVTDNHTGCSFSDTMSVATQSVLAAFTPDPSTGVVPLVVNFTNNSIGETTYSWDFNDGNVSIVSDPQNTFTNTGTYTVVLIVFNGAGTCSDTATAVITVESDFTLIIPNVFTPNGDGANDDFIIRSTGVKEISCDIFNRWGEKMFTITNPNQSWDGLNANGSKASDGTYLYILRVVPFRGEPVEKQGAINLFR